MSVFLNPNQRIGGALGALGVSAVSTPQNLGNPQPRNRFLDVLGSPEMMQIAAGLMTGRPEGLARGMSRAGLVRAGSRDYEREERRRRASGEATAKYLETQGRTDLAEMARQGAGAQAMQLFAQEQRQAQTSGGVFGTPIYTQDAEGNVGVGVVGRSGTFEPLDTKGLSVLEPTRTLNLGTTQETIGGRSGRTYRTDEVDVRGKARETEAGKFEGEKQMLAPQARLNAQETLQAIDELYNHPALATSVGKRGLFNRRIPGSAEYGFDVRLRQLQGKVFSKAYETLKGGGQITEIETAKAEQALARLDAAQDEQDFREALIDFRDAVSRGFALLEQQSPPSGGFEYLGTE